ncbi:MAG: molybdate ABC transporter substrate-binding protein, partial [Sphingobacteriaceae bacterium]
INTDVITGSSGKLVVQIKNGAPYDIFFSADMHFAQILYDGGLSLDKPVAYATGSLIICSTKKEITTNWQKLLPDAGINKIAIANPVIAPYGKAAREALDAVHLLEKINDKLVYGESIAQVNTYIVTGVVDAGFTSQSLLYDDGLKTKLYWQPVDPKTYTPIKQGMVILKRAAQNADAKKFYQYILSPAAKRIFKKSIGYRAAAGLVVIKG